VLALLADNCDKTGSSDILTDGISYPANIVMPDSVIKM